MENSRHQQMLGDPLAGSFATTYSGIVAFIAVVTDGSFSKAANRLGIGRSAVSRSVQKLESQLDVRLFHRTTRSTTLTSDGNTFYASCHEGVERIVQALEEMRDLKAGPPRGRIRIQSTVGFGRRIVAPLLGAFQYEYPEVSVDLILNDQPVDFTVDRVDVAFLEGRLLDSQVIARRMVPMCVQTYASPGYLARRGTPMQLEDLARHDCVTLRLATGRIDEWEFNLDDRIQRMLPNAQVTFNDPELALQAVLDDHGVAQLPAYLAARPLASGLLVPLLDRYAVHDQGHYICYQSRQHMPSRTRAFVDFMADRIADGWLLPSQIATGAGGAFMRQECDAAVPQCDTAAVALPPRACVDPLGQAFNSLSSD